MQSPRDVTTLRSIRPDRLLRIAAVIFVIALAARLIAMLVLRTWEFDPANRYWAFGWETGRIAYHLSEGRGFALEIDKFGPVPPTTTAWLAPLYPAFVGLVFSVLGPFTMASIVTVLVLQSIVSAATAAAIVPLGARVGMPRAGVIGAILMAFHPAAVNGAVHVVWGTTWCMFLCVVVLHELLRLDERPTSGRGAAVGLLLGITLLVAPTIALFCPLAALWTWMRHRRLGPIVAMAVVAAVVVAPWVARNYVEFGRLDFVKSNLGHDFFCGNAEGADAYWQGLAPLLPGCVDPKLVASLPEMNEAELSATLGSEAWTYVRAHPGRFAELTLERVRAFWLDPFDPGVVLLSGVWRSLAKIGFAGLHWGLLALAAFGAFASWRRGLRVGPLLLFAVAYPLPYYLTLAGVDRYRYPLLPVLAVFAAYGALRALPRGEGHPEE